jgi:hypothetical protein
MSWPKKNLGTTKKINTNYKPNPEGRPHGLIINKTFHVLFV